MFKPTKRSLEKPETIPPKRRKIETVGNVEGNETNDIEMIDEGVSTPFPERLPTLIQELKTATKKNSYTRTKYLSQPEKYIDSDINLESAVEAFSALSVYPLCYRRFVELKGLDILIPILSHENLEIVYKVIDLLVEWTDPENPLEEGEDSLMLPECIVSRHNAIPLLVGLLESRVTGWEKDLDLGKLVYQILNVIDNCTEIIPESLEILAAKTKFFSWVVDSALTSSKKVKEEKARQAQKKDPTDESTTTFYRPLFHYLCEVIFGCVNRLDDSEKSKVVSTVNAFFPKFFQTLMYFDGIGSEVIGDDRESFENLTNTLYALLFDEGSKKEFLQVAGLDFIIGYLRNNSFARKKCLKLLTIILMDSEDACQNFIDKKGIKLIFGLFMKYVNSDRKKKKKKKQNRGIIGELMSDEDQGSGTVLDEEDDTLRKLDVEEHLITILVALLKTFDMKRIREGNEEGEETKKKGAGTILLRFRKKFAEKNFQKTKMLVELYRKYMRILSFFRSQVESGEFKRRIEIEEIVTSLDEEEMKDRIYLASLENGAMVLMSICVILCFVCKEEGVKKFVFGEEKEGGKEVGEEVEEEEVSIVKVRKDMVLKFVDMYSDSIGDEEEAKWCDHIKTFV